VEVWRDWLPVAVPPRPTADAPEEDCDAAPDEEFALDVESADCAIALPVEIAARMAIVLTSPAVLIIFIT
jgi:hypothetical protein